MVALSRNYIFKSIQHLVLVIAVLAQVGCMRSRPTGPQEAFREITRRVFTDDKDFAGLNEALSRNISALENIPADKPMHFGPIATSYGAYTKALRGLRKVISSGQDAAEINDYILTNFRILEFYGGDTWGTVMTTGYFEPVLMGSMQQTSLYSYPLYRKPDTLLTIRPSEFSSALNKVGRLKGRVQGNSVVPFYTRQQIDEDKPLSNRGLELVWVDPIDAFFLHIQGSGTIVVPGYKTLHLVYADKNGRRYEAIGRFLKEVLPKDNISMQSITQYLRTLSPKDRDHILHKNPSYVFFKPSKKRAITAMGIPATAGRTIAVDRRFAPKGALAFLTYKKPVFDGEVARADDLPDSYIETGRFVLDQDTGGAITGTGHIDLFCGSGLEAQREAGVMRHQGHLVYFVPR